MNFLRRRSMMSRAGRTGPAPRSRRSRSSRSTSSPNDRARARVAFGGAPTRAHATAGVYAAFGRVREGGRAPGGFCGRVSRAQRRLRRLRRSQSLGARCATGDALRGGRATRSDPQNGASSRAKPAPARAEAVSRCASSCASSMSSAGRHYLAGGRRAPRYLSLESRHLSRPICSHIVPPKPRPLCMPVPSAGARGDREESRDRESRGGAKRGLAAGPRR